MTTTKPILHFVAADDLRQQIDDFYFDRRFSSRSAAIVELVRLGFKYLEQHPNYKKGDINE